MIRPPKNRVFIVPEPLPEETVSGLLIVRNASFPYSGVVLMVGSEVPDIEPSMRVLFLANASETMVIGTMTVLSMLPIHILAEIGPEVEVGY